MRPYTRWGETGTRISSGGVRTRVLHAGGQITEAEVQSIVISDLGFCAASLLAVFLVLWLHTQSLWVTCNAVVGEPQTRSFECVKCIDIAWSRTPWVLDQPASMPLDVSSTKVFISQTNAKTRVSLGFKSWLDQLIHLSWVFSLCLHGMPF